MDMTWRKALDCWAPCLCQDVTMAWYEATVADVAQDEVLIRYIAWDHSFDEWMPRNSERLAERGTRLLAHMAATDVEGTFTQPIVYTVPAAPQ